MMEEIAKQAVGVVGAGLVGSGWAIVFARAGLQVRLYDDDAKTMGALRDRLSDSVGDLASFGLVEEPEAILARMEIVHSLSDAVRDVAYVQESIFERADVKRALFERLDQVIGADTVVGSSSSGIPASVFTAGLVHCRNYLIAHPVNPPSLVPLVEIVPAPWTSPEAVEIARRTMEAVGQVPILVRREVEGFILNRLQGALLREAWALFEAGYASTEDIDKTISHGLGCRWSFMGPFETIDLNAPGGVADYAERLGDLYLKVAQDRRDPQPWSHELVAAVERERRAVLPAGDLGKRRRWRDRRLMALAAHKQRLAAGEPG